MLHLPANLAQAFAHQPAAQAAFLHLGHTARRALLLGLVLAKRPATPPAAPGGHPNRLCPVTYTFCCMHSGTYATKGWLGTRPY
nr:YdeI/OmpD-associated family protein [Hymenobacter profundi]